MRFVDQRRYLSAGIGAQDSVEAWNAHLILEQRGIMKRRGVNEQVPLGKNAFRR